MTKVIVLYTSVEDDKLAEKIQEALNEAGGGFISYHQDLTGEGLIVSTIVYNAGYN